MIAESYQYEDEKLMIAENCQYETVRLMLAEKLMLAVKLRFE